MGNCILLATLLFSQRKNDFIIIIVIIIMIIIAYNRLLVGTEEGLNMVDLARDG